MSFSDIEKLFDQKSTWTDDIRYPAWSEMSFLPKTDLFEQIMNCLKGGKNGILFGFGSRGKTFTAYMIAFQLSQLNELHKKVWWRRFKNPKHERPATMSNGAKGNGCPYCAGKKVCEEEAWTVRYGKIENLDFEKCEKELDENYSRKRTNYLYIVDNCNSVTETTNKFLKWAINNNDGTIRFLFLLKSKSKNTVIDLFPLLSIEEEKDDDKKRINIFRILPKKIFMQEVIKQFFRCTAPKFKITDSQLMQILEGNNIHNNVYRLLKCLKELEQLRKRLKVNQFNSDNLIVAPDFLRKDAWDHYDLINRERRTLLTTLSALGQFDIGVHRKYLENIVSNNTELDRLDKEGHLSSIPMFPHVLLFGPSEECEHILGAIAQYDTEDYSKYISTEDYSKYISNIITKYLLSAQPNISYIIRKIYQNRYEKPSLINDYLIGQILISIFNDNKIWENLGKKDSDVFAVLVKEYALRLKARYAS